MIKRGLLAIAFALAIGLASATPAMAADPSPSGAGTGQKVTSKHVSGKGTTPLSKLSFRALGGTGVARPADAPPGGGCSANWAWDYIAYYTNSVLTSATIGYNTQVVCTATGAGQSMGALVTTAELWKETTEVNEAPPESCTNCLVLQPQIMSGVRYGPVLDAQVRG